MYTVGATAVPMWSYSVPNKREDLHQAAGEQRATHLLLQLYHVDEQPVQLFFTVPNLELQESCCAVSEYSLACV